MLKIRYSSQFKKVFKLVQKRGYDTRLLEEVLYLLADGKSLPAKYCDHSLAGNYKGFRECHIQPDWLLIYKIEKDTLILTLTRTGSHGDLF
ncbi:MAG TPA: type II toxin-antitoxin system YafQ family toxin [Clostridiales bacterium]|jgi:mRNA interferase YafQ|nr:type II toxin-antitoxin system YafQ family toxin [Clostridiales bacterium]